MSRTLIRIVALGLFSLVFAAGEARAAIADSQADFSGTQGQNGWYYGYYAASPYNQTSFQQMTHYQVSPVDGTTPLWAVDLNNYWTQLYATGAHPNVGGFSGKRPDLQYAVRRWISPVAGAATITGSTADQNAAGP